MPARRPLESADFTSARPPPRRRLTREESRAQTRERLLAVAHETFARRGFEGCSVDDLAEAAGYSKGAFYSNFSSKEAVFLELLRRHKAGERAALEKLLGMGGSVEELLDRLARYGQELERNQDWCLLTAEFQVRAAREPAFRTEFNALGAEERAAVGRFLGLLFERAQVDPPAAVPPEQLAAAFTALIQGLALQRAADPAALPTGAVGAIVDLFMRALLGRGQEAARGRSPRS